MAQCAGGAGAGGRHPSDRLPGRHLLVGTFSPAADHQGSGVPGQGCQVSAESHPAFALLSVLHRPGTPATGGQAQAAPYCRVLRWLCMRSAPFIAVNAEAILRRHGLTSFAALWDLDAELVDEPNRARDGISRVSRLRLADEQGQEQVFYLKRQSNYLIRTLRHPLGQSTVAREFQNIKTCA